MMLRKGIEMLRMFSIASLIDVNSRQDNLAMPFNTLTENVLSP